MKKILLLLPLILFCEKPLRTQYIATGYIAKFESGKCIALFLISKRYYKNPDDKKYAEMPFIGDTLPSIPEGFEYAYNAEVKINNIELEYKGEGIFLNQNISLEEETLYVADVDIKGKGENSSPAILPLTFTISECNPDTVYTGQYFVLKWCSACNYAEFYILRMIHGSDTTLYYTKETEWEFASGLQDTGLYIYDVCAVNGSWYDVHYTNRLPELSENPLILFCAVTVTKKDSLRCISK